MTNKFIERCREVLSEQGNPVAEELVKLLLEFYATQQDHHVNIEIVNELIVRYSEAEKNLYDLNQQKNKFLGMAAHDLRNPLTVIIGLSSFMLMEKDKLSPEHHKHIRIIYDTSKKMLNLINDLLDISAIESGRFSLDTTRQQLIPVLRDRVDFNRLTAQNKKIIIQESYESASMVSFDKERISQVIDNLISNAIKFSYPGSKIEVSLFEKADSVVIAVKDSGVGIKKEEQQKLFAEFQKLSSKPTGGEKSSGLGLAIVKKIVEAHKGSIEVQSEPGKGSTFMVLLPK